MEKRKGEIIMTSTYMMNLDGENPRAGANEFHPPPLFVPPEEGTNGRVLVVDDEESIRALLLEILSGMDYEAVAFGNSGEALNHFRKESFDLVLTDLEMPGMDGLTLARYIKNRSPETPVILVTGCRVEDFQEKMRTGCIDSVIAKPFRLDGFLKTVQGMLKNKFHKD
jgi:DNA-binding NtrC family response regulator